jgi:hypothetical protein
MALKGTTGGSAFLHCFDLFCKLTKKRKISCNFIELKVVSLRINYYKHMEGSKMAIEDALFTFGVAFATVYAVTLSLAVWSQFNDKRIKAGGWHRMRCTENLVPARSCSQRALSDRRTYVKIEDRY